MQLSRFARTSVFLAGIGLSGLTLGCGAGGQPVVVDSATAKQNAEEIRKARQEQKASRSKATGGPATKGRGPLR